jgi:SAM-dependent methyltransferase
VLALRVVAEGLTGQTLALEERVIMREGGAEYFAHGRPEIAALLPPDYQRVLEIGCGEGRFRSNLRQPCHYTGVEPSPAAAAIARVVLDEVLTGTFEQVAQGLPLKAFDLVICNDVIEHMVDHDAFLEDVQRYMAPGAWIVGSVPNVRYFFHLWDLLIRKDWPYKDHGILDCTHLRFFTQKSWRRTLASHGFIVERLCGLNQPNWGNTFLRRWLKLALANVVGSDSRFLQIGFAARLGT